MNDALKTKWLWRFAKEDDAMWKNVIKAKYAIDELGWWSKKSSNSHGVGYWNSILTSLKHFKSLVHFEVKNGSRVLFWHDVCGDRPLKTLFSDLFRMARLKYVTVQEVVSWNGDISHWNLTFVRNLNDWEEDSICNLLPVLAGKEVLSQGKDEIVWPLNSKGSFSVKSFYSTHFDAWMVMILLLSPFGSLKLSQKCVSLRGQPP